MANPQCENGFTRIANEIIEALIRMNLSGQELRAVMFVIRKTYGFNKKEDIISLTQFAKALYISKVRAAQVVTNLVLRKILTVKENINGVSRKLLLNKNYEEWKPLMKTLTVYKKRNRPYMKTLTTKDNIQKKLAGKNPAVKKIIDFFYETVLTDKGFKPRINGKASGQTIKQCLKDMKEDEIKNCIKYYINSEKANEKGITLTACLSTHSINLYRQYWQKEKELYV